jgi:glutathione synthase/RimK-type ligase-like ATP-grasp enzyme
MTSTVTRPHRHGSRLPDPAGTIVVLSHNGDPHAMAVCNRLAAAGHPVQILDLAALPGRAGLTIELGVVDESVHCDVNGEPIDLAGARAFWWRRPRFPDLTEIRNADARTFAANEWQEALGGLWQLLGGRWMNPPVHDEVASRKAFQLRVAAECGLRVPRTLITSDPAAALEFIHRVGIGRTIYKTFSCTYAIWRETRLVTPEVLDHLDAVRLAPVIFQEYIPAGADLRVTIVGDRIFPAAIEMSGTSYPVDFRPILGETTVLPTELPTPTRTSLLNLMRRLGLVYGAVDLRRTPAGDHVFLEINTAGEFLFVEELAGLPITDAVAAWLVDGSSGTAVRSA